MQQTIGREKELTALQEALKNAVNGQGCTVLVSGEVGIGKTTVMQEFIRRVASLNPVLLKGSATADALQPFQIFSRALAESTKRPLFEEHEYSTFAEIFAINRAGILVAKAAPEDEGLDADIFAGMFSAVQDFVRDSFDKGGERKAALGKLEYGEMKILIEHGQQLFLVGVFKGAEHSDMRKLLAASVKEIETRYRDVLIEWSGDTRELSGVIDEVESLAQVKFLVRKSMEGISLDQERTRISEEVLGTLEEMSKKATVLMLLEDIHWADESSIFVLNYLARNIRSLRVMILATLRPKEGKKAMAGLEHAIGEGAVFEIILQKFDTGSSMALVDGLYPNHRFPEDFIRKLIDQCEGNPFFATELLKQLETAGSIFLKDGVFHLEVHEIALPSSIEEVVHNRIESLDQELLAVVEFASCIGKEFDRSILAKSTVASNVASALERLADTGIVIRMNETDHFTHVMFQSVIYNSIPNRWKSHYHKGIGEYYEETYRNKLDTVIYELATHFSKTSEHLKIFEYCRQAGEKAESSYSPDLAVEYYVKAISAIPRLKLGASAAPQEVMLLERVGEVQGLRGQFDDSLARFSRALEIASDPLSKARIHRKRANVMTLHGQFAKGLEELDAAEKLLAGKKVDEFGFLLIARSFINLNIGKFDDTLRLSQQGIDIIREAKDRDARKTLGKAWKIMGVCHLLKGNFDDALACHGKGKDIGEELNDLYGLGAAYNNIGNVYLAKGEFSKALEHYKITMELLGKTKDLQGMSYTLNNIGIIHKNRGEFDLALAKYQECLRVLEKIGDPSGIASALNNIGNLYSEQGNDKVAVEPFERALDISRKIGDKQQMVSNLCSLVNSRVRLGDLDKATEECRVTFDLSKELGYKRTEVWSVRNMGMIAEARGDSQKAEKHFLEATEGFRSMGMDAEVAKTLLEHGIMLLKSARRPDGRKLLEHAAEIFKKSGMTRNLDICAELLEENK